ncbi:MAG: hypothetical protein IPI28_18015 [Candidatus Omnitrophica bacterium]|nr:hypothetical protein [Candidatus Omnitrophota bacterium]
MLPVWWLPQIPLAVIQSPYIALRDNDNPAKPPHSMKKHGTTCSRS